MTISLSSLSLKFSTPYDPQLSIETLSSGTELKILDQTLLPWKEEWVELKNVEACIHAIKKLQVRGAPLIGVVASLSLAKSALDGATIGQLESEAQALYEARPTAVNLMICINRMKDVLSSLNSKTQATVLLLNEAVRHFQEDVTLCDQISNVGSDLIMSGDSILTHCNTGGLATAGCGTALGVIKKAFDQGKTIHVYVDETRPLLQGGRLTTWELEKYKIPYTLITDSMAGHLMSLGKINKILVGCDRIAKNGDFANKIGTYSLAVLAHHHRIPFYVVGPYTTMDVKCLTGGQIPIEQRDAKEVRGLNGAMGDWEWAPHQAPVYNPSFDVTPAKYVSGWILNCGLFKKSDFESGRVESCML